MDVIDLISDGSDNDEDYVVEPSPEPVPATATATTTLRRSKRQRRLVKDEDSDEIDLESGDDSVEDVAAVSSYDDDIEEEGGGESFSPSIVSSSSSSSLVAQAARSTTASTTTEEAATPAKIEAYLRERRRTITTKTFNLSLIPPHEIFPTGRTIKKMSGWTESHWPALRELLQNTIDHLGLLDSKTGRRHAALNLDVSSSGEDGSAVVYKFICKKEAICTISVQRDLLVIEQLYTYPLPSRALDTGVADETKFNSTSTAGGFGDGFKTAAIALHSLGGKKKDFESMTWTFEARKEQRQITWYFESEDREAVGKFAKSRVLRVRIENEKKAMDDMDGGMGRDYVMTQTVKGKDIGRSFLMEAVPRLQVFWDVDGSTVIGTSTGGDYIAPVSSQPTIPGTFMSWPTSATGSSSSSRRRKVLSPASPRGKELQPEAGIYVRGIWVRKPPMAETLMCFFGSRLQVSGRDRNDVHEEELIDAVAYVLRKCKDLERLKTLLEPLRGGSLKRVTGTGRRAGSSWLLKSPRFLNQIWMMEKHRDHVLHNVLQIPHNAIFVSSRTTKSSDPFLRWASEFLKKKGAPLVPIEPGANRYLFEEVNEVELTDRCVRILNEDLKQKKGEEHENVETLRLAFRKILVFMGLGGGRRGAVNAKVVFSPDVTVAFVHNGRYVFVPEAPLTRELLVKVLNVCQCHLFGADGEKFSSLVQALFEVLPAGRARTLSVDDVDKVVERAKEVKKENANFLMHARAENAESSKRTRECAKPKDPEKEAVMDLTGDDGGSPPTSSSRGGGLDLGAGGGTRSVVPSVDLEAQIAHATRKAGRKRKGTSGNDDDGLDSIIPETSFGSDDAGSDSCLRPSSALQCIGVNDSLGGGSLLCDERTASDIGHNSWGLSTKARLAALRQILDEAIEVVRKSKPSLSPLLSRVRHGYDSSNNTYEAFCDGKRIVVNLYTYMPRLSNRLTSVSSALAAAPKTLLHDLVVTVTHELAHFLQPNAGHGPEWRDSHMAMLVEVMAMLELKELPSHSSSSSA